MLQRFNKNPFIYIYNDLKSSKLQIFLVKKLTTFLENYFWVSKLLLPVFKNYETKGGSAKTLDEQNSRCVIAYNLGQY